MISFAVVNTVMFLGQIRLLIVLHSCLELVSLRVLLYPLGFDHFSCDLFTFKCRQFIHLFVSPFFHFLFPPRERAFISSTSDT